MIKIAFDPLTRLYAIVVSEDEIRINASVSDWFNKKLKEQEEEYRNAYHSNEFDNLYLETDE